MASKPQGDLKKARQVRVYLTEENESILKRTCETMPDLNETDVVRILLSCGLRAVKENAYRITFPMKFLIADDPNPVNYRQRSPSSSLNEK